MPELLAGSIIRANDRPASLWRQDGTLISDIPGTSYVAGSPVVAGTFVAPTSGRVKLIVGGGMRDNGASSVSVLIAPEVYLGVSAAGTLFLAADAEERGVRSIVDATQFHYFSRRTLLVGLTAGATYYARAVYAVTVAATGCDIATREIGVIPA